jgi:predicted nucleotidyltransferase
VTNVRVFGNVSRGDDGPESDIDLVVDLMPRTGLLALEALRRELTELLGTTVDIAPPDDLRPSVLGLRTENVAHRFAVEWDDASGTKVGVYVPRRDSNSWLTAAGGGRIFPAKHHLARFDVEEKDLETSIVVTSVDRHLRLAVKAVPADEIGGRLFNSTEEAIEFFRRGCLGLSPQGCGLGAVRLECARWTATPMRVEQMSSSLFEDLVQFPEGTCELDGALLMRNLPARWTPEPLDPDLGNSEGADSLEFTLRVGA